MKLNEILELLTAVGVFLGGVGAFIAAIKPKKKEKAKHRKKSDNDSKDA